MIICWWSGGITSAVACKKAVELFGKEQCRVIMIDTHNEDVDTYRFKDDCQKWYELPIETITAIGKKYDDIYSVWESYLSLNTANGAICSSELKAKVRQQWQKENEWTHQVFGFEFETKEFKRALAMTLNYPSIKPIYPLLMLGLSKKDCIEIVEKANIEVPRAYKWGFQNNNCLQTGCVQGGISYWQHMYKMFPEKYEAMANLEHRLTNEKGKPITVLKDQSKESQEIAKRYKLGRKYAPLFLKTHPDYPFCLTVLDKKGKPTENLTECNGFCGTNDLIK